jgi:NADH-quinone oxidoreductase subunit J
VRTILAAGLSAALLIEVIYIVGYVDLGLPQGDLARGGEIGTVENIGKELFTTYLFPFEVTSILLLAAIVGAVVLAKKKLD